MLFPSKYIEIVLFFKYPIYLIFLSCVLKSKPNYSTLELPNFLVFIHVFVKMVLINLILKFFLYKASVYLKPYFYKNYLNYSPTCISNLYQFINLFQNPPSIN